MKTEKFISSKYKGYGSLVLILTGHDYDFIAYIENNTDKIMNIYIDNLEGWYSEPIKIEPHTWVGFLADDEGREQVSSIEDGDFKVTYDAA